MQNHLAIEVKKKLDIRKIKEEILRKQKDNFDIALTDAATEIVIRTRSQQDAKGGRFKPLTSKYKKFKIGKGRSGNPDLTFSGAMLAAITSTVEQVGNMLIGRIFFNSAKEAAKARGNNAIRRFFELSRDQINKITNKLRGQ